MPTRGPINQKSSKEESSKKHANALTAKQEPVPNSAVSIIDLQHAASAPQTAHPSDILALQRRYGNQSVQRLLTNHVIQAKLSVGKANNIYEQEADQVAAQVMSAPEHTSTAQDHNEEVGIQAKPLAASITPLIQRTDTPKKDESQATPNMEVGSFSTGADFENRLTSTHGSGIILPKTTRNFMESRFGADFGNVRLHTGEESSRLNREINAQAFTHGRDIYLGAGKENIETSAGKQLLAHELTHVIQQTGAATRPARTLGSTQVSRLKNGAKIQRATFDKTWDQSMPLGNWASGASAKRTTLETHFAEIQKQIVAADALIVKESSKVKILFNASDYKTNLDDLKTYQAQTVTWKDADTLIEKAPDRLTKATALVTAIPGYMTAYQKQVQTQDENDAASKKEKAEKQAIKQAAEQAEAQKRRGEKQASLQAEERIQKEKAEKEKAEKEQAEKEQAEKEKAEKEAEEEVRAQQRKAREKAKKAAKKEDALERGEAAKEAAAAAIVEADRVKEEQRLALEKSKQDEIEAIAELVQIKNLMTPDPILNGVKSKIKVEEDRNISAGRATAGEALAAANAWQAIANKKHYTNFHVAGNVGFVSKWRPPLVDVNVVLKCILFGHKEIIIHISPPADLERRMISYHNNDFKVTGRVRQYIPAAESEGYQPRD